MKQVINNLPINIKAGECLAIDLRDAFFISHSMFTFIPLNATGITKFKISNAKNNSIEIELLVKPNIPLSIAFKEDNILFDSINEEFHFLEITPENDFEGFFSWKKDCIMELISIHAL